MIFVSPKMIYVLCKFWNEASNFFHNVQVVIWNENQSDKVINVCVGLWNLKYCTPEGLMNCIHYHRSHISFPNLHNCRILTIATCIWTLTGCFSTYSTVAAQDTSEASPNLVTKRNENMRKDSLLPIHDGLSLVLVLR